MKRTISNLIQLAAEKGIAISSNKGVYSYSYNGHEWIVVGGFNATFSFVSNL